MENILESFLSFLVGTNFAFIANAIGGSNIKSLDLITALCHEVQISKENTNTFDIYKWLFKQ